MVNTNEKGYLITNKATISALELRQSIGGGSNYDPPSSERTKMPEQTDISGLYHLVATTPENHATVWIAIDNEGRLAGVYDGGNCVGLLRIDKAGFVSGVLEIFNDRPGEITSQFGQIIPHNVNWPLVHLSTLQSGKSFTMQGVTISMMLRQGFPATVKR